MSTNLVPPQVLVDTPRPQNDKSEAENYNGMISISLSKFTQSIPKPSNSTSSSSSRKKSSSPRISPRASPRLKKK
ncbi:unnamed protein product [Caenorhabditis bovis]|uniref:Uncharacterized protein n=1 Tax=Caenorhabditis bovis TaxID=2654633 RepID=A0A8S1EX01_9PELO|nr:unnamed protein product [Caenorhabditis bovis]